MFKYFATLNRAAIQVFTNKPLLELLNIEEISLQRYK